MPQRNFNYLQILALYYIRYFVESSKILAEKTGDDLIWYYYDDTGVSGFNYQGIDYIYEKNILGDILAIWNTAIGTKIGEYQYDAWGNILHQTNNYIMDINPFRYRGYYYDVETNLYYLNSRYYDPETGRFINADDPRNLLTEGFVPGGTNLYQYCYNNPVMYTDPSGEGFLTALIIAAITFAVVNTGTQLVGDVINYAATGTWESGREDYLGAFAGGLLGGATFFITGGNLAVTFGVMGATETLSTNLMTNWTGRTNYSGWQILGNTALSTGIGIVSGALGGVSKVGITTGRNSFLSVWKSGLTKLTNRAVVYTMSLKTMTRGLTSVATLRSTAGLMYGGATSIYEWIRELLGQRWRVSYV